jgi:hypothetical protein
MPNIIEQDCLRKDHGVYFWIPGGFMRGSPILSLDYKAEESIEPGKEIRIHGHIVWEDTERREKCLDYLAPFDVWIFTYHPPTGDRFTKKIAGILMTGPIDFVARSMTKGWERKKSLKTRLAEKTHIAAKKLQKECKLIKYLKR